MVYFVDHCQERIYTWITLRQLLYQAHFSIHHFKEAIFRFERLMGVHRMKYNGKKKVTKRIQTEVGNFEYVLNSPVQ